MLYIELAVLCATRYNYISWGENEANLLERVDFCGETAVLRAALIDLI